MRNNKWNLTWGFLGAIIVIVTFVNQDPYKLVFGLEINIWLYRIIWLAISVLSLYSYLKRRKEESN